MTQNDLSRATNPDLRASMIAMRRAAAMARETAIRTGTEIVVVRDGKPVRIPAEQLREPAGASRV
jgi:hypothetical protein